MLYSANFCLKFDYFILKYDNFRLNLSVLRLKLGYFYQLNEVNSSTCATTSLAYYVVHDLNTSSQSACVLQIAIFHN